MQYLTRHSLLAGNCLAGVLLGAIAAIILYSNRPACGQAVLYLPAHELDLGIVSSLDKQEFAFSVGNRGTRRLVINEVQSGCGCCEPVRQAILIPPGETKDVFVALDTRSASGVIESSTSFTTNDPNQPRFTFLLRAHVAYIHPPLPEQFSILASPPAAN